MLRDAKDQELFIGDYVVFIGDRGDISKRCYAFKVTSMNLHGWVETRALFNDNFKFTFARFHLLKCPYEIIHSLERVKLYLKMAGY